MSRDSQLVLIFIMIESELSNNKSCILSQLAIRLKNHKMSLDKINRVVHELQETGIVKLKEVLINHTA